MSACRVWVLVLTVPVPSPGPDPWLCWSDSGNQLIHTPGDQQQMFSVYLISPSLKLQKPYQMPTLTLDLSLTLEGMRSHCLGPKGFR